jgi:hypothetical protein
MNTMRRLAAFLATAALAASGLVHAQATRTWVSGVGDDVNPCSRTAPCKTWAGAISKTAAGGEINALDPAGYGALTINKSITIDGTPGPNTAGVLVAGTNGINITAAATDTVTLRGLTIDGTGTMSASPGLVGVRIFSAGSVHLERLNVYGFSQQGVYDSRTAGGELYVDGLEVHDNGQTGLVVIPSSGSTPITVSIARTQLLNNANSGMALGAGVHANVTGSNLSGNANYGLYVEQPAGTTRVFLADSTLSGNGTGILVGMGQPGVLISNLVISNNGTGISPGATSIASFGNNKIAGNGAGNGPFSPAMTIVPQQ